MSLTPEQIENWRVALQAFLGPYALIMPEDQIEQMKERFQSKVNALDAHYREQMEELPFSEGDTVRVKYKGKAKVLSIGPTESKVKWSWGGQAFVHNSQIEEL